MLFVFSSVLGLSSAQGPVSVDPLFANSHLVAPPEGTVLVQGDIVMPEEQLHTRGAYQTWFWPGGLVYYEFAPYISPENRSHMRAAMDELESIADVTFVQHVGQPNYIYIIEDIGNWSYVGMVRGMQELSIYSWDYKYVIVHELMHALGIWHEQSRTDRDTYVTINYDNVWVGYEENFDLEVGSLSYGPYNFCSVMHYHPLAFSYNNLPTIVAKQGYEAAAACMGNREMLTAGDQATIAHLYNAANEVAGDRPATAIAISDAEYTYNAPSDDFGISADEPLFACSSGLRPVTNTVWFTVTPDNARYIDIYTSGYDTVVGIFTGSLTDLFLEACVDYYGAGFEEWIGLPLEAGTTYYIGVGSWVGSSGLLDFKAYSYRNLLVDGGFDWGMNAWTHISVPANRVDDKIKCGRAGIFGSLCALKFRGGLGESTNFRQKLTYNGDWDFSTGDRLWLTAMIGSNASANRVQLTATITYGDSSKQKLPVVSFLGSTNGAYYFDYENATLNRSDVRKIVVKVINKSSAGKTLIDNVTLSGDLGVSMRASRPFSMPTKPQTLAPVANQRWAQASVLPVPPPAN